MMTRRIAAAITLLYSVTAFSPLHGQSAPITVLASNGIQAVLEDLAPRFERTTAQKVIRRYDLAANIKRRIEGGESFDVAVVTPAVADDLIKAGKLASASRTPIARSSLALAIRTGTQKPDIRTTDGFKRVLLDAKAVAYAREGASGAGFVQATDKLGIADRVKKLPTESGAAVGQAVARGTADYGVLPVSEILPIKGVEVLGPFPAEVRSYVVMVGGVSSASKNGKAARNLIDFATAASADAIVKQHGMERATP
jgi:molybdate transport system substrate-binding protein